MKLYTKRAEDFTLKDIIHLREFRRPKEPIESPSGYMLCATCKSPFDVEGAVFCVSCGQKANWRLYWKQQERRELLANTFNWGLREDAKLIERGNELEHENDKHPLDKN